MNKQLHRMEGLRNTGVLWWCFCELRNSALGKLCACFLALVSVMCWKWVCTSTLGFLLSMALEDFKQFWMYLFEYTHLKQIP